jgi:hypothetical protein
MARLSLVRFHARLRGPSGRKSVGSNEQMFGAKQQIPRKRATGIAGAF